MTLKINWATGEELTAADINANFSEIKTNLLDGADADAYHTHTSLLKLDLTGGNTGNTTNETTLFTFSVPANTLSTGNAILIVLFGNNLSSSNSKNIKCTIRLKYGSTTIASAVTPTASQFNTHGTIMAVLAAAGATNAQEGNIEFGYAYATSNGVPAYTSGNGTGAENSTGALTLSITAQWDDTDTCDFGVSGGVAYLLKV